VLLVGLIVVFILYRKEFKKKILTATILKRIQYIQIYSFRLFSIAMILIGAHGIIHEPLIDFRDYKIGTDIQAEKQKISKNPSEYKTFYSLKNEKTGEVLKVNQDDYIKETNIGQKVLHGKLKKEKMNLF
jgi:hypothetical protein